MSEEGAESAAPKVVTPPPVPSPPSSPPPEGEKSDSKSQEISDPASVADDSADTAPTTTTMEPDAKDATPLTTAVEENVTEKSNGDAAAAAEVKEEEPAKEEKEPIRVEEEEKTVVESEPVVEEKAVEKEEPVEDKPEPVVKEEVVEKEEIVEKEETVKKEEISEKEDLVEEEIKPPVEEEIKAPAEEEMKGTVEEDIVEKEKPVKEETAEKEELVEEKVVEKEELVEETIVEKEELVEETIVEKEIAVREETEAVVEDIVVEEEPVAEEPQAVIEKEVVVEEELEQAPEEVVTSESRDSFEEEEAEDAMEDITPDITEEDETDTPVEASVPRSTDYIPPPSIYAVPFSPVDNAARSASHKKLRSYESRRRTAYGSKLSSSSLYWRSFRELIKNSLHETKRAERIVLSRVIASEQYAEHMSAIHDDMLDSAGQPITDPKKKKKVLDRRMKEQELKDSVTTSSNTAENSTVKDVSSIKSSFKLGDSDDMAEGQQGSMLKSLIDSHSVLAARYNECTTTLKEQVTGEITNLREQLDEKITTMEILGDAILDELEAAENEVVEAWEKYYAESSKSIEGQGSDTVDDYAARRVGASFNDFDIKPQKNCTDTWMNEMHYRMAVAYLSACWEKCSAELSRLFTSLKSTEVSRRHRLRELLIIFLEKEESLWNGLPSVISPVLKGIVERPMNRNMIEDNVQNSIKIRAQAIQRAELLEKQKTPNGPGLSSNLAKEGNFELSSPLVSDLMCMGKVVEKKDAGMMKTWKTVLAIVTADSFLHLFEIPTALRVQSGTASEVAFHALVPPVEIPTVQNIKTGFAPKAWNLNLAPSASIVLPNCKIVFNDDEKNTAFEIYETVFKRGARSLLGTTGQKKMYFRTRTYEETFEWIGALQAPK